MNSPFSREYDTRVSPLPVNPEDRLQLTEEEVRILKECNKEGIRKRAIPMGLAFGTLSHFIAKQKNVMIHQKFGTLPIVIASGFVGYFTGRLSYFPVCYERLMQVPDGIVRQRVVTRQWPGSTTPHVGQVLQVDPKTEYTQSKPTDIDLPIMSNFDTMPSNLDSDMPQQPLIGTLDPETPRKYTSYDELRERNRREYMEKMQKQGYTSNQNVFGNPQTGYPPAQPRYHPTQPGYPPTQPGYPPTQPGYPPTQPGYLPTQPGYSPAEPVYPEVQPAYPPSQPQIAPGHPTYQRRSVPVQPSDPEMTPTQGTRARKIKTKYGDEWES